MMDEPITYVRSNPDDLEAAGKELKDQIEACRKLAAEQGYILIVRLEKNDHEGSPEPGPKTASD